MGEWKESNAVLLATPQQTTRVKERGLNTGKKTAKKKNNVGNATTQAFGQGEGVQDPIKESNHYEDRDAKEKGAKSCKGKKEGGGAFEIPTTQRPKKIGKGGCMRRGGPPIAKKEL